MIVGGIAAPVAAIDRRWVLAGGLALALGLVACADDGGPRLAGVEPAAAPRGSMVTLTGNRLCGARGDCATAAGEVEIGIALPAVRAIVVSYSERGAQIRIPDIAPVGPTTLVVTVNERSSNAVDFEVVPTGIP